MAEGLTTKQKKDMVELSKHNNSQRYFRVNGKWYEMIGTKCNTNGSWVHSIKPSFKGQDYITDTDYIKLINQYENENKHLT